MFVFILFPVNSYLPNVKGMLVNIHRDNSPLFTIEQLMFWCDF